MKTEKISGNGTVFKLDKRICDVQYHLRERELPSGQFEARGTITVNAEERLAVLNVLPGGTFVLHLGGHNSWPISVLKAIGVAPIDGVYEVATAPK